MIEIGELSYLFITRTLAGGGAERFIATFASYLADNGYNIHVLCYEKTEKDYPISPKVKLHMMPKEELSIKGKINRIFDMREVLNDINPDIVIPFIDTVVICAWFATLFRQIKFIYTVRVSPWHESGTNFSKRMRKIISRTADAIMIQNNEQGKFFSDVNMNKLYVVPNPVHDKFKNLKKDRYTPEINRIIMIGRLEKQKNIPLALKAISDLKSEYPKLKLDIYGEGSLKLELQTLINNMNLTDQCKLRGRTTEVEMVLNSADLYLMTSDYEGMPNSLIEAMAMGVPCISSDCKTGPADLIISGQNGYLFNVGDLYDLENHIKKMLSDTDKAILMGRRARETILKRFDIKDTFIAFERMIEGIRRES